MMANHEALLANPRFPRTSANWEAELANGQNRGTNPQSVAPEAIQLVEASNQAVLKRLKDFAAANWNQTPGLAALARYQHQAFRLARFVYDQLKKETGRRPAETELLHAAVADAHGWLDEIDRQLLTLDAYRDAAVKLAKVTDRVSQGGRRSCAELNRILDEFGERVSARKPLTIPIFSHSVTQTLTGSFKLQESTLYAGLVSVHLLSVGRIQHGFLTGDLWTTARLAALFHQFDGNTSKQDQSEASRPVTPQPVTIAGSRVRLSGMARSITVARTRPPRSLEPALWLLAIDDLPPLTARLVEHVQGADPPVSLQLFSRLAETVKLVCDCQHFGTSVGRALAYGPRWKPIVRHLVRGHLAGRYTKTTLLHWLNLWGETLGPLAENMIGQRGATPIHAALRLDLPSSPGHRPHFRSPAPAIEPITGPHFRLTGARNPAGGRLAALTGSGQKTPDAKPAMPGDRHER